MKLANSIHWLNLAIALTLAPGLTGCTDDELAVGLGAVAIGAGVIAIGEATEHHGGGHYTCSPGYRTVCHDYRDYRGFIRHECHSEYDSCYSRSWVGYSLAGGPKLLTSEGSELNEMDFATTFNVSFDASNRLIGALESAKAKDLSAILALGLTRDDVKSLAKYSMPSNEGLDALAKSLDQDLETTRAMIQKILDISIRQRDAQQAQNAG